jgi:four helix bundle protein
VAKSYKELLVWQRAIEMTLAIYKLSAVFPKVETYGLASQLRRASVSVASNIAEGYGRGTRGEYKQFLGIARGSICEVQTQLTIARELGYGNSRLHDDAEGLSIQVSKMLHAILDKLGKPKVVVD